MRKRKGLTLDRIRITALNKELLMEFDVSISFADFLIDAIDCHLDAFPELQEQADVFLDLFCAANEMKCTLHINF